ncbi:MAG: macro domain-containing protein [bacterium]
MKKNTKLLKIIFTITLLYGHHHPSKLLFSQVKKDKLIPAVSSLTTALGSLQTTLGSLQTSLGNIATTLSKGQKLQSPILITLVCGNIVQQSFQDPTHSAIVNAANRGLDGGAGITGAIWDVTGGLTLLGKQELANTKNKNKVDSGGLKTGEAVVTTSEKLTSSVKYVIHTPGPDCRDTNQNKNRTVLLANSYKNSLQVADENEIQTIAFPSISTGIYNYSFDEAKKLAIETVINYLENKATTQIKEIRFVMFDITSFDAYSNEMKKQKKLTLIPNSNNQLLLNSSYTKTGTPPPLASKLN